MKTGVIVQARIGSKRLPKKVLAPLGGTRAIDLVLKRLQLCKRINQIILATPKNEIGSELERVAYENKVTSFLGSELDVLDRYFEAAKESSLDTIVRITADCPLLDYTLIDEMIDDHLKSGVDYTSNTINPTYPDGLDVEVFSFGALKNAHLNATDPFDREHVTPYIKKSHQFSKLSVECTENRSKHRWTLDEIEDQRFLDAIYKHFAPSFWFTSDDVVSFLKENPNLGQLNSHLVRNEGASMSSGLKLWKRAKKVILHGNSLLSKHPDQHLPNKWPTYFSRASGCNVWGLDGEKYVDVGLMAIGTNILGYANPAVDARVKLAIDHGTMSTLNCPEEVELAEKLIELNPWASMVKFARSGGEANAIALRIARAASGRSGVAICGYHGWHDWYLAANLKDNSEQQDALGEHLLSGLSVAGVHEGLIGSAKTFQYNNFEEAKKAIEHRNVGVVFMEVERNSPPAEGFLEYVRQLTIKNNCVLIFDECTSGFRATFGGLYKKYGVEPDVAVFAKTLGNGYPISAVVGKQEVMDAAQNSFISSTFWSDRIGPAAALETIQQIELGHVWEYVSSKGRHVKKHLQDIANSFGVEMEVFGLDAMPTFSFKKPYHQIYKTFLTQEMLLKGFLATNAVYISTEHTDEILDEYLDAFSTVLNSIGRAEKGDRPSIKEQIDGPLSLSGFKRLN